MQNFIIKCAFIVTISFQLFFHDLPDEIKIPFFTCVICLTLLLYLKSSKFHLPVKFFFIFTLYIIFVFISNLLSGFSFFSLIELIKSIGLLFFVLLSINLFKKDKSFITTTAYWILVWTAFWSLAGIVEFSGRTSHQKDIALVEPFHFPSISSSFFLLTLPLALKSFLSHTRNHIRKILSFIYLTLIIIAVTLTGKYLVLFFLNLAIGVAVYYQMVAKTCQQFINKRLLLNLLLLLILLIFTLPNLYYSFGTVAIPKDILLKQDQYYFYDFKDSLRFISTTFMKNPLSGIGTGNYGKLYRLNLAKPWIWSDYANSEIFQSLVENGILGLSAFLLLYLYFTSVSLKTLSESWQDKLFFHFQISLALLSLLFLILINPSFRIFPVLMVFFLIFSMLLANEHIFMVNKKIIYFSVCVVLFLSLLILSDNVILQMGKKNVVAGRYKRAKEILTFLTKRPDSFINPKVYYWLATLNLALEEKDIAIENLQRASILEPYNLELIYQKTYINFTLGNISEAKETLYQLTEKYLYLPPKYYTTLAQIALDENDQSRAISWYRKMAFFYPVSLISKPSHYSNSLLDAIDFLSPLQSTYLSLYELLQDKYYYHRLLLLLYRV